MSEQSTTVCALTTIDNPFDPIDSYDEWYAFDLAHGYNTSEYLANYSHTSIDLPPLENAKEIEDSIDEIVELNPFYKKVKKEVKD